MKDRISRWVADRLPIRVRYWVAIDIISHATTGEYSGTVVPDLSAVDALKRFGDDHGLHGS